MRAGKPAIVATASLAAIYIGLVLIYEGHQFAKIAMAMAKEPRR